uniref:Uncharacterized protein n=1 Tax=Branchiostoma floridae TaxID=7739 RepID=C3Y9S4_BRAFL|eukprot:XP_002606823.1 hypothetical protein BRAFLDRAFT_130450 [Branchiostoma floridae]
MNGSECHQLIREFYGLQEERIKVYRRFEEGFETYLNTSPNYDFAPYRQLVHDVTQEFQRISSDVIAIRDRLRDDYNQVEVVKLLEKIQDEEKKKLQLTAEFQVARQVEIDNGDVDHYKEEVTQVKKSLNLGLRCRNASIDLGTGHNDTNATSVDFESPSSDNDKYDFVVNRLVDDITIDEKTAKSFLQPSPEWEYDNLLEALRTEVKGVDGKHRPVKRSGRVPPEPRVPETWHVPGIKEKTPYLEGRPFKSLPQLSSKYDYLKYKKWPEITSGNRGTGQGPDTVDTAKTPNVWRKLNWRQNTGRLVTASPRKNPHVTLNHVQNPRRSGQPGVPGLHAARRAARDSGGGPGRRGRKHRTRLRNAESRCAQMCYRTRENVAGEECDGHTYQRSLCSQENCLGQVRAEGYKENLFRQLREHEDQEEAEAKAEELAVKYFKETRHFFGDKNGEVSAKAPLTFFTEFRGKYFGDADTLITAYNDIKPDECARRCLEGYGDYDGVNPIYFCRN